MQRSAYAKIDIATPTVSGLTVYPIKSTAGIALSSTWIDELGLAFDRRFVLTTPTGEFITARTNSKLCLVQANIVQHGLMLTAPAMPSLFIDYREIQSASANKNYQNVTVWSDTISSQRCLEAYDKWFSDYLDKPCQLMFFGENSSRMVKNTQQQTAFADAYPLLLISQASLDALNEKLESPVSMRQFRPNIVVDNCQAFEEDTWQRIKIGDAEFELTSPCSRCVFTTVDPDTGHKHNEMQPLQTLKQFRQVLSGDVMFGQNLRQLFSGGFSAELSGEENQGQQLKIGDEITVLERKDPPRFMVSSSYQYADVATATPTVATDEVAQNESEAPTNTNTPVLNFSSWDKTFEGNAKETILEQAESAGMMLPYSCRGGMCGRCKVKLDSGEVRQLATDGLSEREQRQGYVLACSSIPLTNVVISKP